ELGFIDVLGRQERLGNDRLREADFLQENRLVLVAERVAGGRLPQADGCDNFPGTGDFKPIAAGAHETIDMADPLRLSDGRVQDRHPRLQSAGINPQENEIAVLLADRLERQARERIVLIWTALKRRAPLRVATRLGKRAVDGRTI